MKEVTIIYNRSMKMSDLIDADYNLLLLLERLQFKLGFGEKNVEIVCADNNFDVDCFLFLANLQSNRSVLKIDEVFDQLPLEPFLYYLKCSHDYFLEKRLPNIRRKLDLLFSDGEIQLKELVLDFFDNYVEEVHQHMKYEDEVAFPYIYALISKSNSTDDYEIKIFEERHNDIEEKMTDLKQILMKYISGVKDQMLMMNILFELCLSEEELKSHTFIEDSLVIPRVRKLEV